MKKQILGFIVGIIFTVSILMIVPMISATDISEPIARSYEPWNDYDAQSMCFYYDRDGRVKWSASIGGDWRTTVNSDSEHFEDQFTKTQLWDATTPQRRGELLATWNDLAKYMGRIGAGDSITNPVSTPTPTFTPTPIPTETPTP